jgi:hypothetical protein
VPPAPEARRTRLAVPHLPLDAPLLRGDVVHRDVGAELALVEQRLLEGRLDLGGAGAGARPGVLGGRLAPLAAPSQAAAAGGASRQGSRGAAAAARRLIRLVDRSNGQE